MNRVFSILIVTLVGLCIFGCGSSDDFDLERERTRATTYVNRLTSDNDDAIYDEYLFEKRGVYRVAFERDISKPMAEKGDFVEYWFIEEVFENQPTGVINTNVPSVLNELANQGLNTEYFSTDIERVELGSTPMIRGLRDGLEGCFEGDSVILILTSNLALGDKEVSYLPKNTMISFKLRIETVEKAK